MIYFYLMKDLPLLAIFKIITTSCNFTQRKKKKKHSTNKQVKLTEEWYKTSYVFYLWICIIYPAEREEKEKTFLEQAAFWHDVKVV